MFSKHKKIIRYSVWNIIQEMRIANFTLNI